MLELYQSEGCPYCEKVRDKMSELGLSYVIHNPRLVDEDSTVTNEITHEQMRGIGEGLDQIPYLVDTRRQTALYESDAIIEYLEQYYN